MDYEIAYSIATKFSSKYILNKSPILVGSLRRKEKIVGDIDLLLIDDIDQTVSDEILTLLKSKINNKIISAGNKKISLNYMGIQIDIFFTLRKHLIPAVVHFTGSKVFNIRIRKLAKELGYSKLNQYGLYDADGNEVKIKSEKHLFKLLGLKYLKPEDRDH